MKCYLQNLKIIIILPFFIIGCSTINMSSAINSELLFSLVQSNKKILVLVNKTEAQKPKGKIIKILEIFDKNESFKDIIHIQNIDGLVPNDFTGLINHKRPDLLKIFLADHFEFDRVYYITHITSPIKYYTRPREVPDGFEFKSVVPPGYIIKPFTLLGPNDYFRFSVEKPNEVFKTIILHTIDQKFNYESIKKTDLQLQIKNILKNYFESSPIDRNISILFQESELFIEYDNEIVDYLIYNISNSMSFPYDLDELINIKNKLVDNVENIDAYGKLIMWLEKNINAIEKENTIIVTKLNSLELKIFTNLQDQYKEELLENIKEIKDKLYPKIIKERWLFLSPISFTVEQQSSQSILINFTLEIEIDEYFANGNIYNDKNGLIDLEFASWIFDELKKHIIYEGYINKYSLSLKKKGSSEKITIAGYTDRTGEDIFQQLVIAQMTGNEYLQKILLDKLKIQYNPSILYESRLNEIPLIIENGLKIYDSGYIDVYLGKTVKTMTGELTKNAYLYKFFNIPYPD